MALAGDVREAERSTRALKPGRGRTESNGDSRSAPQRGSEAHPCCSPARSAASPTTSASSSTCSTALAPLAMLGALDVPARMSPSPAWFALTGTAPALVAAAAAMSGPEPPASLLLATAN